MCSCMSVNPRVEVSIGPVTVLTVGMAVPFEAELPRILLAGAVTEYVPGCLSSSTSQRIPSGIAEESN